ncbi:formylglycine-generating enzyme family protein [Pseudemcibacter aquimaris]|uniref:formylglycine-generating enzyme family protein n=1 Tax=Pseudemcibacter aquimaris TaxID=2857064 RepID=UPI00237D3957|nr:formylglycine-generating enzyme family protein [Pseudemcibacter aquimaris]MCC3859639.1 formylglycine-generating enzyme family protein [Pseudemcibacter aquimaris]
MVTNQQVSLNGGTFMMGSNDFYPDEAPTEEVTVKAFEIDEHEVTNREFRKFIEATNYVTSAERSKELGFPENGSAVFDAASWKFVAGANWKHPEGPGSSIEGRDFDPVVQISLEDALAYAKWVGRRLPTEKEWEFAARSGMDGKAYAWGDEFNPDGEHMANTWQGHFPSNNTADDGYMGRAPVGCFPANEYGLYDIIGNVWEWTQDPYYPDRRNADGEGYDPRQPDIPVGVIKGGSYLCAANFCARYRPAARHAQDTGLGTNHIGFRTAADIL